MRKTLTALAAAAALTLTGCASSGPDIDTDINETEPAETVEEVVEEVAEEEPAELGTDRNSPAPIGTTITDGDWEVTINEVNLDANDIIIDDFNEPPAEGNIYIMVEATVTYHGDDPQGEHAFATIQYVTADGSTIDIAWVGYDLPDFTILDPLYEGASHTGWNAYEVPDSLDGVLAVTADMMSDKVFVALQ